MFSAEQAEEVRVVLDGKAGNDTITYVDTAQIQMVSQKPGELKFIYKGCEYVTALAGSYQMKNAALAIEIARYMGIPEADITAGIKAAVWKGRFEVLSENPYFIIDGAHNVDAVDQLAKTVQNCFTKEKLDLIIGVLKDKDHEEMMKVMASYANKIYTITPPNIRGLDGQVLAEEIRQWHSDVVYCDSIDEAVHTAMADAYKTGNAILAFGSLSYLAEAQKCHDNFLKNRKQ